jgi:hypothetical protein
MNQLGSKNQTDWFKESENTFNIKQELKFSFKNCIKLEAISTVTFGLQTKDKSTYVSEIRKEADWELCYTGKDINRYFLKEASLFFKNKPDEVKAGGSWDMKTHKSKKIVVRQVGNPEPIFAFDSFGFPTLNTMYSIVLTKETYDYNYLISILNSNFIHKYWMSKFDDNKELFPKIKGYQLKQLPIPSITSLDQIPFIEKAETIISFNKELQEHTHKFLRTLERKFSLSELPKKLQDWYLLSYSDFIKELGKKKIILSLSEEAEWESYFTTEAQKALELKSNIEKTDKEIDQMVYTLYELTEDEIKIVEES